MWRNYSVLLAIVPWSVVPAVADVVDVIFGGAVTGGGGFVDHCPTCPGGVEQGGFSLSGMNNNADDFTTSGISDPTSRVVMSGFAQQVTTVSPTSWNVDLETLATLDAAGAEWGADVNISTSYFLSFTLTTESVMHLTETVNVGSPPSDGYLPNDVCFLDNTDSSIYISLPCFNNGSFDQSFTLGSGTYGLEITEQLLAPSFNQGPGFETHDVLTDHWVLTADFTPVVPEPRWTFVVPVALLVVISGAASLRKRRALADSR